MSHFTVLVVGDSDVGSQLAPFHDFECTGIDDEHVVDVDVTDEVRSDFKDYGDEGQSFADYLRSDGYTFVGPGESPDDGAKYQRVETDDRGEVVRIVRRTNPNAKWDWWVVGGRWCGFFPLKPGAVPIEVGRGAGAATGLRAMPGTGDRVRRGDIDLDRARAEREAEARALFDQWAPLIREHGAPRPWSDFLEMFRRDEITIDEARYRYGKQPVIRAARKSEGLKWEDHDSIGTDVEDYVRRCRNDALVPFAVLKDGKWHERGKMGWWAIVTDAKPEDQWQDEVQRLYDDLPDDTILTLVDCHI